MFSGYTKPQILGHCAYAVISGVQAVQADAESPGQEYKGTMMPVARADVAQAKSSATRATARDNIFAVARKSMFQRDRSSHRCAPYIMPLSFDGARGFDKRCGSGAAARC